MYKVIRLSPCGFSTLREKKTEDQVCTIQRDGLREAGKLIKPQRHIEMNLCVFVVFFKMNQVIRLTPLREKRNKSIKFVQYNVPVRGKQAGYILLDT